MLETRSRRMKIFAKALTARNRHISHTNTYHVRVCHATQPSSTQFVHDEPSFEPPAAWCPPRRSKWAPRLRWTWRSFLKFGIWITFFPSPSVSNSMWTYHGIDADPIGPAKRRCPDADAAASPWFVSFYFCSMPQNENSMPYLVCERVIWEENWQNFIIVPLQWLFARGGLANARVRRIPF